jgi:uncharacterized protein YjbI with pentapeptide repeats
MLVKKHRVSLWQCRSILVGVCLAILISAASSSLADPATRQRVISQLESGTTDLSNLQAAGVDLSGVDFRGARLFGANLDGANLSNAKLARCNLDLTLMRGTVLVNADLREASIFGVLLERGNLSGADLRGAHLMSKLDHVNLEGANLSDLKAGADMRNQPMGLIRIVLTNASLKGAKLIGADLSRGDLSYADLREADLTRANLTRVNLTGANLGGAKLDGANVTDAQIHNAIFIGATGLKDVLGLDSTQGKETATFDP